MKSLKVSEFVFLYFKSTLSLMRYFGFAPFTVKIRRNNSFYLKSSLRWTIYSYSFALVFLILVALDVYRDSHLKNKFIGTDLLDLIIKWTDEGGITFIVLHGIAIGPWKLQQLFNLIANLDKIHLRLSHPNSALKNCKRNCGIIIGTSFIVVVLILIFDFYTFNSSRQNIFENSARKVCYSVAFYIYHLIMISQLIAYCTIMHLIERHIWALNSEIIWKIQRKNGWHLFLHNDITNLRKSFGSKNMRLMNGKTQHKTDISAEEIHDFMKIHEKIYQSAICVNNLFGYFLLFILINCLIQTVNLPWTLFSYYKNNEKDGLFLALNIIWLAVAVCRLFLVIEPSHRCLQEYDKIGLTVTQLLKSVDDILVRKEVEVFVHQVQLLTVDFTSADIVYLRRPLLASITSAVTTYLVILIQLTPNNS